MDANHFKLLKSIINTQIDELVSGYEKREISKTNDQISKRSTDSIKDHQHIDSDYHKTGEAIENELSKYLRTENLTSVTQPGIVTKLTESVWEHIHAALRIARQGDADKAKLHLDIADQALNEVGHYMSSDDFSRLVSSVEQYLFKSQE